MQRGGAFGRVFLFGVTLTPNYRAFSSTRPWILVLALVAALMLLATIFYPFGYDQAVFSTAGEMILHGAAPYRDFLDTKPPFIFYIYALALRMFGPHEWSIHALDILYQLVAGFYFYRILRRKFSADVSVASVSLTLILYAGSGFWMTVQAESFALLPSLVLLDVTLRASERPSRAIYYGLLAGVGIIALLLLKFTLVLGVLAALLFLFFIARAEMNTKRRYTIGFILSSLLLMAGSVFAIWRVGAMDRLLRSLTWLASYASIAPAGHSFLEETFLIFPERIVYSMSISLLVFAGWGFFRWYQKKERSPMLTLLLLTFLFQLFGILLEQKIAFPYQYTRALWAITPFMAIGSFAFVEWLMNLWKAGGVGRRILSALCAACILLLSPVTRIWTQSIPWTMIALDRQNTSIEVQRRIPNYFAEDSRHVAQYLRTKMEPSDQLFFWGNDVALYFSSNKLPQTICLTATPFRTAFTPPEWKATLLHQLAAAPPKYVVVEFGDARPDITGSTLDSYQALLQWDGLASFLTTRYVSDTTIGHFLVFSRTNAR